MSTSMTKDWTPLNAGTVAMVPATVGVFEIADGDEVLEIAYAGGHSAFGLRGALQQWLDREPGLSFRYERTNAYISRFREVLQVYINDTGRPPRNPAGTENLPTGRIRQN